MSDRIGGCRPQRSLPRSRMFRTRTPGWCTSGLVTLSMSRIAKCSLCVERARPPPRCLHAPVSTGRQAIVRNCIAPLRWCSGPMSGRSRAGCVVAYSRANRSISFAGRATVAAMLSGAYCRTCSTSASYPTAYCETYSWSTRPSRTRTCIIASASAASLAGLIGRGQSAPSAGPGPEMEVRDDRVRPPQHDVPAMDDLLRIDSGAGSNRGREACGSDRAADVAVEAATPHRPEQPHVERGLLYQSLHARRAVGQDGFGARFLNDRLPP